MLSPDTELLRATVSDMNLARQAIADINLSSSHHRLALDDLALHEFLSDTRHYLIVAICDGKVLGSLYGYALRHPLSTRATVLHLRNRCSRAAPEPWSGNRTGRSIHQRSQTREGIRSMGPYESHQPTSSGNVQACRIKRCGDAEAVLELAL
jgi:hypothetical protein